jgi:predicted transcriptional regulator
MPETTDMDPQKVDPHLTTRIVQSYVRHHTVGTGQVAELITSVHGALAKLGRPIQPEQVRTPAVPVRRSVHQDYVVCLDCGYRAKMLGRHISKQHGLSPDEYLKRWGLRGTHPLIAPGYSEHRSTMAKERGFGRRPKAQVTPAALPGEAATLVYNDSQTLPPQRRGSRSRTKQADALSESVAAPPLARRKRPRSRTLSRA